MTLKTVSQIVAELQQRLHRLGVAGTYDEGPAMARMTCEVTYTREQFMLARHRFECVVEAGPVVAAATLQGIAAALGEVERLRDPDGKLEYFTIRTHAWLHMKILAELLREPIEVDCGQLGLVMIELAQQLDTGAPRTAEVIASFGAELTEVRA